MLSVLGLLIAGGAILLVAGAVIVPVVYVANKMFMHSITKDIVRLDKKDNWLKSPN